MKYNILDVFFGKDKCFVILQKSKGHIYYLQDNAGNLSCVTESKIDEMISNKTFIHSPKHCCTKLIKFKDFNVGDLIIYKSFFGRRREKKQRVATIIKTGKRKHGNGKYHILKLLLYSGEILVVYWENILNLFEPWVSRPKEYTLKHVPVVK